MSDTLRTDTLLIIHDMDPEPKVLINHARALERALNNADARIKRLEEAGDFLSRYLREMPYASDYLAQVDERILRISNWRRAKEDNL